LSALRDFNGDGTSDLLLQNDNGTVEVLTVQGDQVTGTSVLGTLASGTHIQDVGDFNGDQTSDILLRNDAGTVSLWTVQNGQVASTTSLGTFGNDWHIEGVGDFNGDQTSDILWRNDSGAVAISTMQNGHIAGTVGVAGLGTDWAVLGVGDLNGDGTSDLLLGHGATGTLGYWDINSNAVAGFGVVTDPGNNGAPAHFDLSSFAGLSDVTGDGTDDLVFRTGVGFATYGITNNQIDDDHITAIRLASRGSPAPSIGEVVAGGEYGANGRGDFVYHDTASGTIVVQDFDGQGSVGGHVLATVGNDWHLA
jgi:hypothetical protein